ncbi:MAG: BACON domain-containing protein, partial [Alistipes sp.]|nr:BACON domain-containing protein [Alistipes sp.]
MEGGEQTIAVTSNGTWVATCLEGDVVITPATGSGDGSVVVTVPTTTAARNFVVKFDVSKQTLIAGTDMVSTTKASAEVTVSQNATGTDANDYLFYENCGDDVEKNSEGYWPYIDQFEGWNPQGEAATNVTYSGTSASVRASGGNYKPTDDAVGISGQPYAFLNKVPAQAHFVIENIAVTGGSNYIFTFNTSCQTVYSPLTFAEVTNSLVHLELGYDGVNWDAVDCTYTPNGGNGWHAAVAEFKVAADATKLYARFTYEQGGGSTSDTGCRLDDFKLVAGGNGAELVPEAPAAPELPEQPTDPLAIPYSETFEQNQGYFTINDVLLGDGLTYVWKHENGQYGYYMKASAYKDGAKASESWLISPEISLVGTTAPAVSFEHCHKFAGTPSDELTLWISEDKGVNWAQLTIPVYGTNNDYNFVANTIDLTSYVGKNVKIAFKYVATSSAAGTWEVKNFKVAEKSTAVEPEPEITETITGLSHIENLDGVTAGKYYFAAYSTKNSSEEVFTKFPYHLWTGTVTSGKADTANYAFADGVLSRD